MGDLYETDFIAWTEQQAGLLRAEAQRRSNAALDWAHVAEEIEDLGRSELSTLASQIERIIVHLLKLEFSAAREPRRGWEVSIDDARSQILTKLRYTPGLRPRLPELVSDAMPEAARRAMRELRRYGEDASGIAERMRSGVRYTTEQVVGDWFPPGDGGQ